MYSTYERTGSETLVFRNKVNVKRRHVGVLGVAGVADQVPLTRS